MTPLEEALRLVVADLAAAHARFAIVGGIAASAWGEPRLTRDVDVAVAVGDDRDAEALVRGLTPRGYRILAQVEHEGTGRLATVRLLPPLRSDVAVVVDLLFASSGVEPEVVAQARDVEVVAGLVLPVARPGHVVAMKTLAFDERQRPQDWDDVRTIVARADAGEVAVARDALRLIAQRGYSRGQRLLEKLDAILA